jgi:hypothetical protein
MKWYISLFASIPFLIYMFSLLFIISSKYSFIFVNSKTTFIMIYKFNYWIIIEKRLTIKSNRIRNIIELSVIIIILFFFIISRKLQN